MPNSVTVQDLIPGEIVIGPGQKTATFVQRAPHPLFPGLAMVVWKMEDGTWYHDALAWRQEVGDTIPSTEPERIQNLKKALLHRSQW